MSSLRLGGNIESLAKETLAAVEQGDALSTQLFAIKKLDRMNPDNTIGAQRGVVFYRGYW